MSYEVYAVLHLISGFLLVAVTFQAFAAPDPARRKRTMIATGVLSLLMLTGGFGMLARLKLGLEPWVWIKVACWIVLSGVSGLAFRRPMLAKPLTAVATGAVCLAVYTVYSLRHSI